MALCWCSHSEGLGSVDYAEISLSETLNKQSVSCSMDASFSSPERIHRFQYYARTIVNSVGFKAFPTKASEKHFSGFQLGQNQGFDG